MFERIFAVMLIGAVLPCFAQHGPIGRAIKATQVVADPADMSYTTNTVVQEILEDIDDRFGATMPGTNIANSAYNPSTLTWGGLMKGTNIANAAYDPETLTWTGVGTLLGTNVNWSVNRTNTWYRRNELAESQFIYLWGGTGAVLSAAAANTYYQLDPETNWDLQTTIDPGAWLNTAGAYITIPETGVYFMQMRSVAALCGAQFMYKKNGAAVYYGFGNAGPYGANVTHHTEHWLSTASFQFFKRGDTVEFFYRVDIAGDGTHHLDAPTLFMYLTGPTVFFDNPGADWPH